MIANVHSPEGRGGGGGGFGHRSGNVLGDFHSKARKTLQSLTPKQGMLSRFITVQSAENRRKSVTDSGYAYVTQ